MRHPPKEATQGGGRVDYACVGRRHDEEEGADRAEEAESPRPRRRILSPGPTPPAVTAGTEREGCEWPPTRFASIANIGRIPAEVGQQPRRLRKAGRNDRLTDVTEGRAHVGGGLGGRDKRGHEAKPGATAPCRLASTIVAAASIQDSVPPWQETAQRARRVPTLRASRDSTAVSPQECDDEQHREQWP